MLGAEPLLNKPVGRDDRLLKRLKVEVGVLVEACRFSTAEGGWTGVCRCEGG